MECLDQVCLTVIECPLRVSIDTQPHMTLVPVIPLFVVFLMSWNA